MIVSVTVEPPWVIVVGTLVTVVSVTVSVVVTGVLASVETTVEVKVSSLVIVSISVVVTVLIGPTTVVTTPGVVVTVVTVLAGKVETMVVGVPAMVVEIVVTLPGTVDVTVSTDPGKVTVTVFPGTVVTEPGMVVTTPGAVDTTVTVEAGTVETIVVGVPATVVVIVVSDAGMVEVTVTAEAVTVEPDRVTVVTLPETVSVTAIPAIWREASQHEIKPKTYMLYSQAVTVVEVHPLVSGMICESVIAMLLSEYSRPLTVDPSIMVKAPDDMATPWKEAPMEPDPISNVPADTKKTSDDRTPPRRTTPTLALRTKVDLDIDSAWLGGGKGLTRIER